MLSHDWQQLEVLKNRSRTLRTRFHAASREQTRNFALLDRLRAELAETQAEHDELLERISRELATPA
ncbi:MAG: hypothetical protein JO001_03310 [Alphaproteobacteria bacterium]|nr:hypothetical protein [Alphaproteobacteria bacterium]